MPVPAGLLAAAFIIIGLSAYLSNPFWPVALFSFVPVLPVQALASRINKLTAPERDLNNRFSGWNWLVIIAGSAFIVLGLLGTFLPDEFLET
jgi:CHASE2 domain-containing sensor protein